MMTINQWLAHGEKVLKSVTPTAMLDTQWMLCDLLDTQRGMLVLRGNDLLDEKLAARLEAMLARRVSGEPLQYILGHQEFMGLLFEVDKRVLIPRQDTEVLVETVIHGLTGRQAPRVLDIGAGSGAISISIASYIKDARVTGVDISPDALGVARHNARRLGVEDRVTFVEGDLFTPLSGQTQAFDAIVSNPPYIPSRDIEDLQVEVRSHEPALALDGGEDGYDCYRKLVDQAHVYLKDGGLLAFETGHDQARTIGEMMKVSGWYEDITVVEDLAGVERVVLGKKRAVKAGDKHV